jgi:hypothetical protein
MDKTLVYAVLAGAEGHESLSWRRTRTQRRATRKQSPGRFSVNKSELTRTRFPCEGLLDGCDGGAGEEDHAKREKLSDEDEEGDITQLRLPLGLHTDAVDGVHKLFGELQAYFVLTVQATVDAHD